MKKNLAFSFLPARKRKAFIHPFENKVSFPLGTLKTAGFSEKHGQHAADGTQGREKEAPN